MPLNKVQEHEIDLDVILNELGRLGNYQMFVYCYIMVAILFASRHNAQYVFNAMLVNYRCRVPECESTPEKFDTEHWGSFALPKNPKCYRNKVIGGTCSAASFDPNTTITCTDWVYEQHLSIFYEFNLACEEWKRALVGTVHSAGVFAAMPITATISDTYGRRIALILGSIAPAAVGIARAFLRNYYVYLVFEFFEALVGAGTYSAAFILALEMVHIKNRVLGGCMLSSTFATGQSITAMVAWVIPYWRTFTVVIYAPSVLFVFYFFFVEESVRWLLSKGNKTEAIRIIKKAAKINKVQLSKRCQAMLVESHPQVETHSESTSKRSSNETKPKKKKKSVCSRVIHSKTIMFRICLVSFWWMTTTMIYYGISINSVELSGNGNLNYILVCFIEIPGYMLAVVTLDRFGRRSSIMIAYFFCGIALLLILLVDHMPKVVMALTMTGKLCISMVFTSIYIYTVELFPTEARHALMGSCSMVGRIGSMTAPLTPLLMVYSKSLPYMMFGCFAGVAGILMLFTPETLNMKLPDTIEQAENMAAPHTTKKTDIIVDS